MKGHPGAPDSAVAVACQAFPALAAELPQERQKDRPRSSQSGGLLLRTARYLLWSFPGIYSGTRFLSTNAVPQREFDLWVGGFPIVATTGLAHVFECAFRGRRVVAQFDVPPLIIRAARSGRAGATLITSPREAVVSCSLATGRSVRDCLEYYIDFYRILWPHRLTILLVSADEAARNPAAVVQRLERRFALPPTFFDNDSKLADRADEPTAGTDRTAGVLDPTLESAARQQIGWQIDRSPTLRVKLRTAERLYRRYRDALAATVESDE